MRRLAKLLIALFLVVLGIGSFLVVGRATTLPVSVGNHATISITPQISKYKSLVAPSCYGLVVNATVSTNSTIPQTINIQSFYIAIILPNQPVANTTNTLVFSPNNQVNTVLLFPSNPILLEISFNNICLPVGTNPQNDIKLAYFDQITFLSWTPTIGAGNTITWS